jgi:arylformamidase
VAVTRDGARRLVERGLRLVGVDFLSVERDGPPDFPVHRTLLGGGVVIVEGLDLSTVDPGPYTLVCAPLKVLGGDGAPARVLLIET